MNLVRTEAVDQVGAPVQAARHRLERIPMALQRACVEIVQRCELWLYLSAGWKSSMGWAV